MEIGDTATIYGTDGKFAHPAHLVARSIGTVTSDLSAPSASAFPAFISTDRSSPKNLIVSIHS